MESVTYNVDLVLTDPIIVYLVLEIIEWMMLLVNVKWDFMKMGLLIAPNVLINVWLVLKNLITALFVKTLKTDFSTKIVTVELDS